MEPKEIVYHAIERRNPPRVPIHYCNRDFDSSDTWQVSYGPAKGFAPAVPGMTEWGYVWKSLDQTMGQPEYHPLADWAKADTYASPDPYASGRFDHLAEDIAGHSDRFIKFGLGITGFNTATFLRGYENLLMDLHLDRARAERVLDMVFGFETQIIEQAVTFPVDCITFGDDWGTQKGLMIRPELWREAFKPRYAEQFARAHRASKKVWLHTCGDVYAIIGDLIEVGVDVLELLQPDIFGVERLARDYGGKVCFCCSVDHQRRAVSGTREEITSYARLLKDKLGAFDGGFIAYIEDYASLGMTEQNYQWIRQAFHGLEPYSGGAG